MKFSNNSLNPPMLNKRKPQFTNPVKLSNPDVHENSESLGWWHLKIYRHKSKFNTCWFVVVDFWTRDVLRLKQKGGNRHVRLVRLFPPHLLLDRLDLLSPGHTLCAFPQSLVFTGHFSLQTKQRIAEPPYMCYATPRFTNNGAISLHYRAISHRAPSMELCIFRWREGGRNCVSHVCRSERDNFVYVGTWKKRVLRGRACRNLYVIVVGHRRSENW